MFWGCLGDVFGMIWGLWEMQNPGFAVARSAESDAKQLLALTLVGENLCLSRSEGLLSPLRRDLLAICSPFQRSAVE